MERIILTIVGALIMWWTITGDVGLELGPRPENPWPGIVAGTIMLMAAAFWRPDKEDS